MKLRHTLPLILVLIAALGCASAAESTPAEGGTGSVVEAKKRCKKVVKRINGRRRRVTVCRNVRPRRPSPVIARIDIGADAWIVTAAEDGSVWTHGPTGVVRIDPATNRISLRTRVQDAPSAAVGSIWVTAGRTVRRLDPATGAVQATITLPYEAAAQPFAGAGAIWIPSGEERPAGPVWYLTRVDPASNSVVTTVPMCDVHGHGGTFASESLWLACNPDGEVVRLDPATGAVQARIDLAPGIHSMTSGAGSVWVTNHETGMLSRIDAATNRVVASIRTSTHPAIVFAENAVWAAGDTAVLKIDPATNRIVGRLPVGFGDYYSLAYASGSLWLSTIKEQRVLRLNPRRLRRP